MKYSVILVAFLAGYVFAPIGALAAPTPNDAFYAQEQKSYFSQARIPEAWDISTGSSDIVIAVIDSGVDMDHPDIIENMWFNPGEIALNGIDDDANGYVDDLNGWDFLADVSDPHPKLDGGYTFFGANHGTTVAGVAASVTNNKEGLAGVCWNCKIMALRALDSFGRGETKTIAKAIDYAVANGAHIINMSFVGPLEDVALNDALKRAYTAGVTLVAAVGNDAEEQDFLGGDLDFKPEWPVCVDTSVGKNISLGVGSVESDNTKSSFSNYGLACIDINAPGGSIAAPQLYAPNIAKEFDNKYRGGWAGTSLAAPIVSGIAGLMKSANTKLSNKQIIDIIRETGTSIDKQNPAFAMQLGKGLVNAEFAVRRATEVVGEAAEKQPARTSGAAPKQAVFAAVSAPGRPVVVAMVTGAGETIAQWQAYPSFFTGGASVAMGDVDGDGEVEVVTGASRGGGPQVRIFSMDGTVEGQFFAYDKADRNGVNIAIADTNGDGIEEIITSQASGHESVVKVFNKAGKAHSEFTVVASALSGGLTIAAGDVDADGAVEIVVGSGGGSLPQIGIFDIVGTIESQWLAYPDGFRGAVHVSLADVDSDGEMEIIASPGAGGGPQIRIFDASGGVKTQFFAADSTSRSGINAVAANIDDDPALELIVGNGNTNDVRVFSKFGQTFVQDAVFRVFEDASGGVLVGT